MSNYPELSHQGYQIEKVLGKNSLGGRVTYKAQKDEQPVVLKHFQFAQSDSSWTEYKAYESEIAMLQQLAHPSIPRYLDSFETPTGFCLVQEYKQAISLASPLQFTPQQVREIALAVLEVLVYLQQQYPPIIHRDIKPENILVERGAKIKVYLVDFGFARPGGDDMAVSSVVKGTLGFMPPEQMFNRQLTKASDLYSLGATLICLLTQTKSSEIGNLIDETNRINFRSSAPKLHRPFYKWLEKMVAPSPKERYPHAQAALNALQSIEAVKERKVVSRCLSQKNSSAKMSAETVVFGLLCFLVAFISALQGEVEKTAIKPVERVNPPSTRPISDLDRLLTTGECRNCELAKANLEGFDLAGVDLEGANLEKANLRGTVLHSANLKNAHLRKANLSNSVLEGSDLEEANLKEANLDDANLIKASLEEANLKGATLNRAQLNQVNLEDANLEDASLEQARLISANLQDAYLWRANLEKADLLEANLAGANLQNANLEESHLEAADLEGADLRNADLRAASLTNANLEGANLKGAYLEGSQMNGANFSGAILPYERSYE